MILWFDVCFGREKPLALDCGESDCSRLARETLRIVQEISVA